MIHIVGARAIITRYAMGFHSIMHIVYTHNLHCNLLPLRQMITLGYNKHAVSPFYRAVNRILIPDISSYNLFGEE